LFFPLAKAETLHDSVQLYFFLVCQQRISGGIQTVFIFLDGAEGTEREFNRRPRSSRQLHAAGINTRICRVTRQLHRVGLPIA